MSHDKAIIEKAIGAYWSKVYEDTDNQRISWWNSDYVKKQINKLITDVDSPIISEGLNQLLKKQLNGRQLKTGISVGCGVAVKEMRLIELGIVDKFILFDLSEEALKVSEKKAQCLGMSDKIELHNEDAFLHDFGGVEIDLVHWNNSLHHMFDVPAAVKWSYDILASGGVFYMDDYVGPNRFQHSDYVYDIVNGLRKRLCKDFVDIGRTDPALVAKIDPSEAVDSERILENVRRYFPDANITLTGGLVYFLTLTNLYHLFDESNEDDLANLELLMKIDKLYANHPNTPSLYATALAFKK